MAGCWVRVLWSVSGSKLQLTPISRLHTSIDLLKKSKETVVIRRRGEFLYGVAPCLAALQANRRKVHAIYLKPGAAQRQGSLKTITQKLVWELAKKKKVEIQHVDKSVLERLSEKRPHQGIVIDASPLNFKNMDASECKIPKSNAKRDGNPLWLALDEIHDPMNLGAIIRCAYFLGVDRIIATAKKCCPLTPVVSKASAGAMETMPVYAVSWMEQFLTQAVGNGWAVLGTVGVERMRGNEQEAGNSNHGVKKEATKSVLDCHQCSTEGPTMVVLGNEGYGLQSGVEKACTALVTIAPLRELPLGFDSLNVAVATGIILHSLQQNRHKHPEPQEDDEKIK